MRPLRQVGWRELGAGLLALLLVGTVVGAWVRALRPGDRLDDASPYVERVDWVGTLATDGTLAVRAQVRLSPAGVRQVSGDVPLDVTLHSGAARLRVDGVPVPMASPGRSGPLDVAEDGHVTLAYDVPGAAYRSDDGVLLVAQVAPRFGQFTDSFGYAEVRATLVADSGAELGDGDWRLPGAKVVRADQRGAVVGLAGAASTYDPVYLVASLPASAAPDASVLPHGVPDAPDAPGASGAVAGPRPEVDALATGDLDGAADALSAGRVPDGHPLPQGALALVVAVVVTVELVVLAAWAAWHGARTRARRAALAGEGFAPGLAGDPGDPDDSGGIGDGGQVPPEDLDPDVAAMLVVADGATLPMREAVAANLLRLVDRGEVRLESLDSRRFVLEVPPGEVGANAAERAIVTALRPQGQAFSTTRLVGPPLWGGGPHPFLATVESDVRRRGRQAGYLARTLRLALFVPLMALVPVTALVGSANDERVTGVATLALLAALALSAAVSVASPLALTPRGEAARRRAQGFAAAALATGAVADLGAPAILVRGPYLVYAVATGVAPVAAADVGTGRTLLLVAADKGS